jgi:hypothetical protein
VVQVKSDEKQDKFDFFDSMNDLHRKLLQIAACDKNFPIIDNPFLRSCSQMLWAGLSTSHGLLLNALAYNGLLSNALG